MKKKIFFFGQVAENILSAGKTTGSYLGKTLKLMVGLPDYEIYVEHMKVNHPNKEIMTYEEFFKERQNSRYGGKNRIGCC